MTNVVLFLRSKKHIILWSASVLVLMIASGFGGYLLGKNSADKQNSAVTSTDSSSKQSESSQEDEFTSDIDSGVDTETDSPDMGDSDDVNNPDATTQEGAEADPAYEVKKVGESLTFEIRPKSVAPAYYVDYRLSGEVIALGSAVDIGIIDSSGRYRNVAGLIITSNEPRVGQIRIPFQVYDCSFSEMYDKEDDKICGEALVDISKGMATLIVTHAPTNEIDISVPIEIL